MTSADKRATLKESEMKCCEIVSSKIGDIIYNSADSSFDLSRITQNARKNVGKR